MPIQKTILLISGPTAVGKTGIAIEVAEHFDTAIISADSRQCYRGMKIGTAQPSSAELARVKHYFVDAFPVTRHITAADYERLALSYLEEIFKEKNIAVVCGGTGLYIRALCEGLDAMPEVDPAILQEIEEAYSAQGIIYLQSSIQKEDTRFFSAGEMQNPARLIRALSFVRSTGKSIFDYFKREKKGRPFRIIKTALELPREMLYHRINSRVDAMMEAGLLEEVKSLIPYRHLKNLHTVGYSEFFDFLDGKSSFEDAVNLIKQHSRNYAKRQLTWFRKDAEMQWLRADDADVVQRIIAASEPGFMGLKD